MFVTFLLDLSRVVRMNTSYGSLFIKPDNGFMTVFFLGLFHGSISSAK